MSDFIRITATLAEKTSGIVGQPFLLDGPLAWAEATRQDRQYPPITRGIAPEIPLPLEKWEKDGQWGWCCSQAQYEITAQSVLEVRKKPADQQLARFSRDKKNHHGLGPHKARDFVIPVAFIPEITWSLVCTDVDWFELLIDRITHLGAHRAIGLGKIKEWSYSFHDDPQAWKNRPFTPPTRPPYWHHERKTT